MHRKKVTLDIPKRIQTSWSRREIQWLAQGNIDDIIAYLDAHNFNINDRHFNGMSALELSIYFGKIECVLALLNKNADPLQVREEFFDQMRPLHTPQLRKLLKKILQHASDKKRNLIYNLAEEASDDDAYHNDSYRALHFLISTEPPSEKPPELQPFFHRINVEIEARCRSDFKAAQLEIRVLLLVREILESSHTNKNKLEKLLALQDKFSTSTFVTSSMHTTLNNIFEYYFTDCFQPHPVLTSPTEIAAAPWENEFTGSLENVSDKVILIEFMNAIALGNSAYCEKILKEKHLNLNIELWILPSLRLETPLNWAIKHKQANIAALLIRAGANVDLPDSRGDFPLYLAAMSGDTTILSLLLNHNVDVAQVHKNMNNTMLDVACNKVKLPFLCALFREFNFQHFAAHVHQALPELVREEICDFLRQIIAGEMPAIPTREQFLTAIDTSYEQAISHLAAGYIPTAADVCHLLGKLPHAIERSLSNCLILMIYLCQDINAYHPEIGFTPLILVLTQGRIDIFPHLINCEVDVNKPSANGIHPLSFALFQVEDSFLNNQPSKNYVRHLLDNGADPTYSSHHTWSAIHLTNLYVKYTQWRNDETRTAFYLNIISILTNHSPRSQISPSPDSFFFSLLRSLPSETSEVASQLRAAFILLGKEKPCHPKWLLTTAHLMSLTNPNQVGIIDYLLKSGVPFTHTSSDKSLINFLLLYAVINSHYNDVSVLISLGADINAFEATEKTPLEIAIEHRDRDLILQLLNSGAKLDQRDYLTLAIAFDCFHCIADLVHAGANPFDFPTTLKYIFEKTIGSNDIFSSLLHACKSHLNNDPNRQQLYQEILNESLCNMAKCGHRSIAKKLLDAGADKNYRNAEGQTAYEIAVQHGHSPYGEFIQEYNCSLEDAIQMEKLTLLRDMMLKGYSKEEAWEAFVSVHDTNPTFSPKKSSHNISLFIELYPFSGLNKSTLPAIPPENMAALLTTFIDLLSPEAETSISVEDIKRLKESLMQYNCDVLIATLRASGLCPISLAIKSKCMQAVLLFLYYGVTPTVDNFVLGVRYFASQAMPDDRTQAALNFLVYFLESVNHHASDEFKGTTPLIEAINRDLFPTVLLLLEQGADIEMASTNGITPLEEGITNLLIARELIERSVNVNRHFSSGFTPVSHVILMAINSYTKELHDFIFPLLSLLFQNGASRLMPNSNNQSVMVIFTEHLLQLVDHKEMTFYYDFMVKLEKLTLTNPKNSYQNIISHAWYPQIRALNDRFINSYQSCYIEAFFFLSAIRELLIFNPPNLLAQLAKIKFLFSQQNFVHVQPRPPSQFGSFISKFPERNICMDILDEVCNFLSSNPSNFTPLSDSLIEDNVFRVPTIAPQGVAKILVSSWIFKTVYAEHPIACANIEEDNWDNEGDHLDEVLFKL